ncbi:hypothetical protein C2G38_2303812 [Gigaspora rosea]|uniref:Uncharacterized protein n=1 Tax=Gigaspora rosea TaxID=44941 RepID=A0A397TRP2_9GLOM|nr:hypothetical protein C2G38_2303812 [Gigaspora rosea]
MVEKDIRLEVFFEELYASSNPRSKNEETRIQTNASEEHAGTVDSALAEHAEKAMVLNIDDYHSIHTERMPNTTTTSTAAHLATILMNPISTQIAIPQTNVHNPVLVDAESIKTNIENRFMMFYGLSHNQRWEFRTIDNNTRLEELTLHSYDIRLKEKRHVHSMKDVVLVDLQQDNLNTMDEYLKAINVVTSVSSMQQYIENRYMIPVVADWPGQIYLRSAISCPLHISLNSRELVFLQYRPFFTEMYSYIFEKRKPLAQTPKPWCINLLLEISRSAWQEISKTVEEKFGPLCKNAEYLTLKDLLDNTIPLELINHPILHVIKAELPKFSDATVEIFHSFLRRSTQKHDEAQQIINYGRYLNQLRMDGSGFRENFAYTSTWATYEYSARDITNLTKKGSCFLLQCFSEIYIRVFHHKSPLTFSQPNIDSSSKKKGKSKEEAEEIVSLTTMKMLEARL